ncbi:MAG: hypothetical protein HC906_09335 [Bacteroidales bacterium]|nr:hypothetical protein [Bacteroidales bacterium]
MKTQVDKQTEMRISIKVLLMVFLLLSISCSFAGNIITGVVKDENGQPLPGVNVMVKGTTNGTITDVDGLFSIEVKDSTSVLVFSFIGYENEEVKLKSKRFASVTLKAEQLQLEEVVVTGYSSPIINFGVKTRASKMEYKTTADCAAPSVYFNPSTETYASVNERIPQCKANRCQLFYRCRQGFVFKHQRFSTVARCPG